MFETSKHVAKTEKRCCVFENKTKTTTKKLAAKLLHGHTLKCYCDQKNNSYFSLDFKTMLTKQ